MTDAGDRFSGDPRVLFAAERTLLAWIRTGLAMMGFGFVVARFGLFLREISAVRTGQLPAPLPGRGSLWVGIALVFLGVAVNAGASLSHLRFVTRFRRGDSTIPSSGLPKEILLAATLALLGIVLGIYLIVVG